MASVDSSGFERGQYDLIGIVVETTDPEGLAELLGTMLGSTHDHAWVALPGGEVVFEQGEREMITAMTASGSVHESADIDGLTIRFTA